MKKYMFILLAFILALQTNAQDVKFMGLDMNMNFDKFCQNLQSKGLKLTSSKLTTKEFEGTFAGYNDCEIIVTCTDNTKVVKSVEVIFPFKEDEYARNNAWKDLLQQYKNKYGDFTMIEDGRNIMKFIRVDFKGSNAAVIMQRIGPTALDDESTFSIVYQNLKVVNESSTGAGRFSDDL